LVKKTQKPKFLKPIFIALIYMGLRRLKPNRVDAVGLDINTENIITRFI